VAVHDNVADLVRDYVYDKDGAVWELSQNDTPYPMTLRSFRDDKAGVKVTLSEGNGVLKSHSAVGEWLTSPARVTVKGAMFDPRTEDKIIVSELGRLQVNTFLPPQHRTEPIDMDHVNRFLEFLGYLAPNDEERAYLLNWLAAKVQNLSFRGCAIVMYTAGVFGTGRGTLSTIMTKVLGQRHVETVTFKDIVGGGEFNEWQATPLILVDEVMSLGEASHHSSYERLKEVVDPTAKMITINPKKERKFTALSCASFLFLTNHLDAIKLPEEDRRFYPIAGARVQRGSEYFDPLYEWIESDKWAHHIYNWFLAQEVDISALVKKPDMTESKREMLRESMTLADKVFKVIKEEVKVFRKRDIIDILDELSKYGDMPDNINAQIWTHKVSKLSKASKNKPNIDGSKSSVRVFNSDIGGNIMNAACEVDVGFAVDTIGRLNISKIVEKIRAELDESN